MRLIAFSFLGADKPISLAIITGALISSNFMPTKCLAENAKGKNGISFSGNVSWYGANFHGRKTASGEIFDMHKSTAAHRTLPFFTKVLVENPKNGQSCIVKVNDRGPFVRTRVMDLSREGARRVGSLSSGVIYAECMVLEE